MSDITNYDPVKEAAADLLDIVRRLDGLDGDVRKALLDAEAGHK